MAENVVTSTIEMGKVTLVAKTPEVKVSQFAKSSFLEALKGVSRKRTKKSETDQGKS